MYRERGPSSTEVKNRWNFISTPYVFMAWYFVKHRSNFAFTLERKVHINFMLSTFARNLLQQNGFF